MEASFLLGPGLDGRGSFEHGSIGHYQPQQPVPRDFPLFKRCEWFVFYRFLSKRRSPGLDWVHFSFVFLYVQGPNPIGSIYISLLSSVPSLRFLFLDFLIYLIYLIFNLS